MPGLGEVLILRLDHTFKYHIIYHIFDILHIGCMSDVPLAV